MLSEELYRKAMKTSPAQVGHFIEGGFMDPAIQAVDESFKVVGPAFTISLPTNDNAMLYYAMMQAPKGSVLVISRLGEDRFACCGEIVVLSAKSLGMAGIVVDGPCTDVVRIKEIGLPVFSAGRSAVTNTIMAINGTYGNPVTCGGTVVCPGDIIFGDADGVIVAKPDGFETLVDRAIADDEEEDDLRKVLVDGKSYGDMIRLDEAIHDDFLKQLKSRL